MADYGYIDILADNESNSQWMPAITSNQDRLIHHTHDGNDSPILSSLNIGKTEIVFTASRQYSATGSYTIGSATGTLPTEITPVANDYIYGPAISFNTYIVSATGQNVTLSSPFTASATGTGVITTSKYKCIATSVYQGTLTLPIGTQSTDKYFQGYVSSVGDLYLQQILPTLTVSAGNTATFEVNSDLYDITFNVV